MISPQLSELMSTLQFRVNGMMMIRELVWGLDKLSLILEVDTGFEDMPVENWKIDVHSPRKHEISNMPATIIEVFADHNLLKEFNEDWVELYFTGNITDKKELEKQLRKCHKEIFGNKLKFNHFLNRDLNMDQLMDSIFGLFARGPVSVLDEYRKVLNRVGLVTNFNGSWKQSKWTGSEWVADNNQKKLLLLGESLIVAEDFTCTRLVLNGRSKSGRRKTA